MQFGLTGKKTGNEKSCCFLSLNFTFPVLTGPSLPGGVVMVTSQQFPLSFGVQMGAEPAFKPLVSW